MPNCRGNFFPVKVTANNEQRTTNHGLGDGVNVGDMIDGILKISNALSVNLASTMALSQAMPVNRMPVTKEPHRSSNKPQAAVPAIDAVRCAHQHPTCRAFGNNGNGRNYASRK